MKKQALFVLFSLFMGVAISQTQPLSLTTNVPKSKTTIDKDTPVLNAPAPNVSALLAEDELAEKNGEIFRIGVALNVNEDIIQFGDWEVLPNGDRKLTMVVESEGAEALSFEFDNFHLPVGGTMRAFNAERWHYSKLFTNQDNRPDNGFFLPMVYGDEIIIEIIEPSNAIGQTIANLENVFYNYRETGNPMVEKINESDPCQVNVNCAPEGDFWQDEKGGVARIYAVDGGSAGLCTGSLINNTAQDCKPYFLTALHCGDGTSAADMNNWVFYFEYEAPGCTNPGSTGTLLDNFVQSCFRVADSNDGGGASGSDFLLLQLGNTGNEALVVNTLKSYNAYWNGWDINNTASNEGVSIHHPSGDIKKISTFTSSLQTSQWNGNGVASHWRVTWSGTANGHGVTEGGSSGSPIFRYTGSGSNQDSKIVGTLTGGASFCTATGSPDYYGKMSYHWTSNGGANNEQLEPWLDPINAGVTIMNGSADPCGVPAVPVADFTANQTTVLEGATVNFTDLTSGVPDTWSWTITPGTAGVEWQYVNTTSATSQNPEVQFNTAGVYTVELTASNAQGTDTETKVDYITVNAIVCGEPTSAAYTMGFENGEDLSQWVVINANGDANTAGNANTWGLYDFSGAPQGAHGGDNVAGYFFNNDATTAADDWIITGCLDLIAGANYTMTYWWSTGDGFNETMEVFVGTDQTVVDMTQSIQNLGTVTGNTWTQETINFTVPSSGEYYVGFHCTSGADEWYISIDDINLTGVVTGLSIINTPADITVECDESTNPSNTGSLTATTGCAGGETINYTDNIINGSCANAYTIERTWTATDGCGGSETHLQTITVQDITDPTVNCGVPSDFITTSGGSASLPNYIIGSTISDNCTANGDLIVTQNPSAGTSMSAGTYTVTISAEDECGNVGSCSISVTVQNNETITITNNPADLTIECDESTNPSNTGNATATTSCVTGGLTINYSDNVTAGACVNASVIERTWVITDNCGNNETFVQTITVDDNTAPVVVCGQSTDQLNTSTTVPLPDYTSGSTFSDNCTTTGNLIISQNPTAGTSMAPGNYTVVISAEDECGNISTCEVDLTVINNDGITITISPNDATVDCDESTDPSNTGALTAQTTCATGGLNISYSDVSDNQTCPETITRTWTVTDNCGDSDTYVQLVFVDDLTAPTANTITSSNFECASDIPAPNTALVTGVSDNCTANPSVYFMSDVSNGQSCPETITRTYGVEDDCGNVTEVTQDFIIEDVTNPTANSLSPLSFECTADIPTPNTTIVTGVSDNCTATPTVTFVGDVSDGQSCPETIIRTYEVSDDCGNSILIDQTIVIEDITAPSVTPLGDINVQCASDIPASNTTIVNASDNCVAIPTVTHVGDMSDGQSCPETITRTYRVEDACGNFIEVTQSIIVNDDTNPVITCGVTSETILASEGSTVPNYITSTTATDNCTANPAITQTPAAGSALTLGSNTITMTSTDDCGNESTCTIDVLYEDDASIGENELSSISFYPNPTTNILNVDFGVEVKDATIVLYDANGKLIVEKRAQNKESETIDLSIFAKGMYTVIVHSKNGMTSKKVSKM